MQGFHYIVVGAGTAGCVLAARLPEDANARFCLEAGGPERTRAITVPSESATVRPGRGALAAVVRELDDARIELADVTVRQPTLEDVYIALTGAPPGASSPGLAGARS